MEERVILCNRFPWFRVSQYEGKELFVILIIEYMHISGFVLFSMKRYKLYSIILFLLQKNIK